MHYIYCISYKPLFFALCLKKKGKKIKIITHSENIIKFCENENIDYISYKKIPLNPSKFYKIFSFRTNLEKLIKKLNFSKKDFFYFTSKKKSLDAYYLSKVLSKKGTVYVYDTDTKKEEKKYKSFFLRGGLLRVSVKIILGISLVYYHGHGVPVIGVDNKFFKRNNIKEFEIKLSHKDILLSLIREVHVKYNKFDNLIIDDGPISKIVKRESLIKIYKGLLDLPIKFAFKLHPIQIRKKSDSVLYNIFKSCDEIPEYYPVELFLNNVRKNVISVYSASLNVASQLSDINAISLLNLVEWYDDSFKKYVKKWLIKESGNKILFPKDFDELKSILLNRKL